MNQKKPTKPGFPKAIPPPSSNTPTTSPPNELKDPSTNTTTAAAPPPPPTRTPPPGHAPPPTRTTLADWAAANNDEDEYLWGTGNANEKRQRGGRRAKRKRQQQLQANNKGYRETDWDEIYDPARPTNVDEYLRSDERIREVQEWKAVLYAHRRRRQRRAGSSAEEEEDSEEDSEVEGRARLGSEYCYHHSPRLGLANNVLNQINSLLQQTTPLHRRPCLHHQQLLPQPGTPQTPSPPPPSLLPYPTTQQATMPTPAVWQCQAWAPPPPYHRPRPIVLLHHRRLHHLHLQKKEQPFPAVQSATKHRPNPRRPNHLLRLTTPWT